MVEIVWAGIVLVVPDGVNPEIPAVAVAVQEIYRSCCCARTNGLT